MNTRLRQGVLAALGWGGEPSNPAPEYAGAIDIVASTNPYIITISGHFSAGKDTFKNELRAQMLAQGRPVIYLINYKSRGRRSLEIPSVDYIPTDPQQHEKLVADGEIVVSYKHDGRIYGLSRKFLDVLKEKIIPLMITDEQGLLGLEEYLRNKGVPNRLVSFMLHTNKYDAFARLIERAGRKPTLDEVKQMQVHMRGYADEIERYRAHEELFRHVLKSPATDGNVPKEEQIRHTGERAMSILDLEGKVNAPTSEDFRELYVGNIVNRLFDNSIPDLIGSISQGIQLPIQRETIEQYSREHHIDPAIVRNIARKKVLSASIQYGYLSLYIEPATTDDEKRILSDLVGSAVGVPHQLKNRKLEFARDSSWGLNKISDYSGGLIGDLISFSPYDPMRVPRQDARIHTLVIHCLKDARSVNIEPLPLAQAKKIIEGNGSH